MDGRLCRSDTDCSRKQYCYEVSGRCVDYTVCNRYNRDEAQNYARHASQCGPCFPGYTAEVLGSGETEDLCKKINKLSESDKDVIAFNYWAIFIPSCVCIIALIALAVFLKRRCWRRDASFRSSQTTDEFPKCSEVCAFGPTAPPPESSPFIQHGKRVCPEPINNNQNLKDKNTLLRANAYNNPYWVRTDPTYDHRLNDEDLTAVSHSESVVQIPPEEDTSPSSWTPEEVTGQVPSRPFVEFAIENRDNTANAILQRNSMAGNNNENTSDPNNAEENRDRTRTSNVMITQKITMNLNVVNGDC